MRKIVIAGATGTIGKEVANLLANDNKVVRVGYQHDICRVDCCSKQSFENLFEKVGKVDGVICTAGTAGFGRANEINKSELFDFINNKLIGQVNLVSGALKFYSTIRKQDPAYTRNGGK